jgi:hypothetical protein
MELSSEQLKYKLQSNEKFMVYIYGRFDACCLHPIPIIDRVENKLRESNSPVNVYKYDLNSDGHDDITLTLIRSLGVRNMPTLLFFAEGKLMDKEIIYMKENEILAKANKL